MADFATPTLSRDQLVLFPERLDQAIPADHAVRLLDDILGRIDWTTWEQDYDLTRGQPPIHPRVLAGAVLYGLLKRIRTSRSLEEAIEVRNDFRWLVEGRSVDHTTICKFRQKNSANLKSLFVQIALLARELGHLPLASLGFDGTRLRANNRKTGTRTPEELRKAKTELAAKFAELVAKTAAADADEDKHMLGSVKNVQEAFGLENPPDELLADGMKTTKFNKNAFVYDAEQDSYWCPAGKEMPYTNQTIQNENGRQRIRFRYDAAECLGGKTKRRQVGHEQHEAKRIAHAEKMSSEEGKEKYSRRRHPGERPFAMIKQHFGARRFLTRGLDRVGDEWLWLSSAFNLHRLMSLIQSGPDPPCSASTSS